MPGLNKNRKRNLTIAFRVTPDENETVTLLAKCANMTKQSFIMSKLTDKHIEVVPSIRTIKALRDAIGDLCAELSRIRDAGGLTEELCERTDLLTDLCLRLGGDIPLSAVEAEDVAFASMTRD